MLGVCLTTRYGVPTRASRVNRELLRLWRSTKRLKPFQLNSIEMLATFEPALPPAVSNGFSLWTKNDEHPDPKSNRAVPTPAT